MPAIATARAVMRSTRLVALQNAWFKMLPNDAGYDFRPFAGVRMPQCRERTFVHQVRMTAILRPFSGARMPASTTALAVVVSTGPGTRQQP